MRALVHPYPSGLASPTLTADLTDDDLVAFYAPPGPDQRRGDLSRDGLWVRFNFVSSADGAATVRGRSDGLGTPADQRLFALLRRPADVILVGAGTVRAEGYGGDLVSAEDRAWRESRGLPSHPAVALVSGSLDLDPESTFFTSPPVRPLVLTTTGADAGRRAALGEVADIVDCGTHQAEPARIRAVLAERGHRLVHSEGGPTLLGAFTAAGLADELCLSLSPLLAGGAGGRIIAGADLARPSRMDLVGMLEEDGALFLRYRVTAP
ncbi:pyrimidine reductase family protein [Citricoccus nitrophenolicus]|uniref:Riboflavin biosynthesis pyrimidine reductase n=1 Tax=Citricoccus muralis TaxID=169134 RepID=A0A3D9LBF9_9MICC|nr:pyrimidine reductase family protein [Citricoccus muralis]REE03492.1 riboflavin biosynthesis pyrimidine reductase [Citricoccus muralis]